MTGLQLLAGIPAGLVLAFILYGVWLLGLNTYMEATWWLFPPLAFCSTMFSAYCVVILIWRGVGLHFHLEVE